jgi:hypothetical protein
MTKLINMAMADIKGPEMNVKSFVWGGGWQSVYVSFDARKVPFQHISGPPDHVVAFHGSKFISEYEADHDTAIKVADYLFSKFGIRIGGLSYDKAVRVEQKCQEVKNSIMSIVVTIKDMLWKWKASLGLLKNVESTLSVTPNPEHMVLYGKLITVRCTLKATLKDFSEKIKDTEAEYHEYFVETSTKFAEVITHLVGIVDFFHMPVFLYQNM